MNTLMDRDALIAAWLDDGPATLPADTRQSIAVGIRAMPRRQPRMSLPFDLGRIRRPSIDLRQLSVVLGSAAVVVLAAVLTLNFLLNQSGVGGPPAATPSVTAEQPTPPATPAQPTPPPSQFHGTWISTADSDGGTQTTTVEGASNDELDIVVTDTIATVCSGAPSTMTGLGSANGNTLVIPEPDYRCDDGSEPQLSPGGPPLNEFLRNLTYKYDAPSDTLSVGDTGVWYRPGTTPPSPAPSPGSGPGFMWPQANVDEVRSAQELADAGDPEFTWQVDPRFVDYEGWDQVVESGGPEIGERFLREELGLESVLFVPFLGDDVFWSGGAEAAGRHTDLRYLICAAGETNTMYPDPNTPDQLEGADRCAPTLDDLRYEVVSIDITQPVRRDATGIWGVSRWSMTSPFAQADSVAAEELVESRLAEFLQARLDGEGAEGLVNGIAWDGTTEVPLLYATTDGAPYERYEIEQLTAPRWPYADMQYAIRLFAEGGDTVVEQLIQTASDGVLTHFGTDTTENGQPVPVTYLFYDGEVSIAAPAPWRAMDFSHWTALTRDELTEERIYLMKDPVPVAEGCASGSAAADAEALAQAIEADPDFVATAPVAVTFMGRPALSMEITAAPGASVCEDWPATYALTYDIDGNQNPLPFEQDSRIRLYLLDAPGESSFGTFVIAVVGPESRFESVLDAAAPVLESMEFHAPEPQ